MANFKKRFLVCLSFNGAAYCGWQVQKIGVSVQQVVQLAIEKVLHFKPGLVACSRTDAGVHANNFYFHFDLNVSIEPQRLKFALNLCLPGDIAVNSVKEVDFNFHARYSAKRKEYIYKIWNSRGNKNPFLNQLVWHYDRPINFEKMKEAANFLIGTHDFTSFCSLKSTVENKTRTIFLIDLKTFGEIIVFRVVGSGFLYNMVRIFVGTLIEVSEGLIEVEDLAKILTLKDRNLAGRTVPASGLYLNKVFYF